MAHIVDAAGACWLRWRQRLPAAAQCGGNRRQPVQLGPLLPAGCLAPTSPSWTSMPPRFQLTGPLIFKALAWYTLASALLAVLDVQPGLQDRVGGFVGELCCKRT